jgi:hypothetical protein
MAMLNHQMVIGKKKHAKKTHVQTCQKPMRRHQTFRHQDQLIETIWTRATLFGGAIFAWDHTSFAEAKVDTTPCTWARFTTAGTTYCRSWVGATFPPCGFVRTAGSNLRSNGFHGDKRRTWGYHRDIMGSQWWPGWWFQLCVSNHIWDDIPNWLASFGEVETCWKRQPILMCCVLIIHWLL